tara:strand:- start:80619 stop:80750 length:132 start_codon:yes stop_codon:yes gene_type:complete
MIKGVISSSLGASYTRELRRNRTAPFRSCTCSGLSNKSSQFCA